jgi:uncharacterized protein involved in outer membrane biogenesis
MTKRLWLAAALAGLFAGVAGYAAYRLRALDTPEFKKALLERIRGALGADVQARELEISLLRGVSLEGLSVANPPGFAGRLLEADSFRLRYDLLPLLRGRLQVDEVSLDKPVLSLAMNARGVFNYEKLAPAATAAPGPRGAALALPLQLVLSRLAVTDARITIVDHAKAVLLSLEDADLDARFQVAAASATGSGTARLESLGLANLVFVRNVSAPLALSRHSLRLAPIDGRLADGGATGELSVDLEGGLRYSLSLEVKGAQVETLLREARSTAAMTGALQASAAFEGTGGLSTVKGRGRAHVSDCRVRHSKLLAVVAATLQLPELAQPDFDECRVEFSMARGRMETPVVALKSPAIQLAGAGSYRLNDDTLAYDMTLALDRRLLGRIPIKEIRAAFGPRADGLEAVDFKVSGTSAAPRTDLLARIGKAGATEVLRGALGKLFGRKKKPND